MLTVPVLFMYVGTNAGIAVAVPVDKSNVLFSNLKCSAEFAGIRILVVVVAVVLKLTNAGCELVAIRTTFGIEKF